MPFQTNPSRSSGSIHWLTSSSAACSSRAMRSELSPATGAVNVFGSRASQSQASSTW